jgi:hypothetical protein
MAISLSVDHDRRRVLFRVAGVLDTEEMLGALREAFAAVPDHTAYDVLSDHTALSTAATPEQIGAILGELDSPANPFRGGRTAIVVSRPASFGMMRMLGTRAAPLGMNVQVFWARDEAERWLDDGDAPSGS